MEQYSDLQGGRDKSHSPAEPLIDLSLQQAAPEIAGAHGIAQGFASGSPSARRKSRILALVLLVPTVAAILIGIVSSLFV